MYSTRFFPISKIFPVNTKCTAFVFCYKTSSSCVWLLSLPFVYIPYEFLSRKLSLDKGNAICGSVVVMVAMCNIMFYKILPLSSGHRTI